MMTVGTNPNFLVMLILIPLCPLMVTEAQIPTGWDMGINYIDDDSSEPFQISDNGEVTIEFFVDNSEILEITVLFEYEIPFGGNHDGPEEVSIPGQSNESFELEIGDIDVFNYEARKIDSFEITATLTARQGTPIAFDEPDSEEGDLIIPTIHNLALEVDDPIGPVNAGAYTILRVAVTNIGNTLDSVGSVEVSDDCPLLTTDNGLDELTVGSIEPGGVKQANLKVTASESHPSRRCEVEVSVNSNGASINGRSVVVSDEVKVTIEPPKTGNTDEGDAENQEGIEESVQSNLPSVGLASILLVLVAATSLKRREVP